MKRGDFHPEYGTNISTTNDRINESQKYSWNGHVYIFECEFIACEATGSDGGAILVESSTFTNMQLESSSFINCKTDKDAGAIWFGRDGHCVISKVCGFGCCATKEDSYFLFHYVETTELDEYKNQVNDSTVTHSIDENCEYNMEHRGFISFNGVNNSLNNANFM